MAAESVKYSLARAQVLWEALLSELGNLTNSYNEWSDKERSMMIELYNSCEQDLSILQDCFPVDVTFNGSKIA